MQSNIKKQIEDLLKDYPYLISNVLTEIKTPLSGIDYDKILVQTSNDFHSTVEDYLISQEMVADKVKIILEKIRIIETVIDFCLSEKEKKFVSEYYWQHKTEKQLADGRYSLYSTRGIRSFKNSILQKLLRGNILKVLK